MINLKEYEFFRRLTSLPFVEEVWLFGSRARGDQHDRSDIDIAIVCPNASDQDWDKVMQVIDSADTLLKVDCVRFDKLNDCDKIRQNILDFKVPIYEKGRDMAEVVFWKDYFDGLGQALDRLHEVVTHEDVDTIDYMQDAAIQRFEFVIKLFWKVLKKVLIYEKVEATTPRDVLRQAFQFKLIDDESMWLSMLDDRNSTSHVYKQEEAFRVFNNIKLYLPVLQKTYRSLKQRYKI